MRHQAVFLDRDGTIIEENGYISKINQVEFILGSIEAIKILKALGYKIIILSNQSGVAQGFITAKSLKKVNHYLLKKLTQNKAAVDGLYYCPHHPRVGLKKYKKDCDCRKPKTGLLRQAVKLHKLTLKNGAVIGDKLSDVELGKRAKVKSILVLTGYGRKESHKIGNSSKSKPDFIAKNLLEAARFLQSRNK